MRIAARLLTNSVLIASFSVIVTTLLIGGMSFTYGKYVLEQEAKDRLALVRDLKADSIKRYFHSIENQAITFSNNLTIINSMQEFLPAFYKYAEEVRNRGQDKYKDAIIKRYIQEFSNDYAANNGGLEFDATPYLNSANESTFALQYNYIFDNPYGIDKESKLEAVNDGTTYSKVHKKYHPAIREFKELFDFEDIFLVDPETGDIIYTVAKGLDFTTSLKRGPYSNTALGEVFRRANAAENPEDAQISNFAAYSPSNDDQAAFVATAIYADGKKIGILIFQLNLQVINDIMTSSKDWKNVGLGDTGESYLVDNDKRMITMSRSFIEDPSVYLINMKNLGVPEDDLIRMQAKNNNMGLQTINTLGANNVIDSKAAGFAIYKNYRGVEVLGAYEPLNISGLNWGIVCEIDKDEAFAPVKILAKKIIINLTGVMLLILIFAIIVGIGLARQISLPIEHLNASIEILSKTQDLTQRIDYESDDEIGDMAKSLNHLIESFQHMTQETINSTQKVQFAAHKLMTLADDIDNRESTYKFQDNYALVHEKIEAIKDAGDSLEELSSRLQSLSKQFKVFEAESDRTKDW